MKPSDLKSSYPWESVFQKTEAEIVALNIIKILSKTGDYWRELSWFEYKEERLKDKHFTEYEHHYFDRVVEYTISPQKAKSFCSSWNKLPLD